jgi:hypothetical protein
MLSSSLGSRPVASWWKFLGLASGDELAVVDACTSHFSKQTSNATIGRIVFPSQGVAFSLATRAD